MRIPILYFVVIVLAALALGVFRRHWLAGAWLATLLVFPTAQTRVGDAPIYLYDLLAAVLLVSFLASGELTLWPRGIPQWHWWLVGAAFVLSVLFGVVRFGFMPDILWIWGHASLSWLAFAFGIIASLSTDRPYYRASMRGALLLSTIALCLMAVVQFANLPGSQAISNLCYGHLGSEQSVEILRLGEHTNRATGPHFAPTGFAGMGLLCGMAFWLLSEHGQKWQRGLVLAMSSGIILCTVSRHAMVAVLGGLIVLVTLSQMRMKAKILALSLVISALLGSSALGLATARESWSYRLSKWKEGLFKDENINARVFWGPARLVACFADEPTMLVTGAGLDPEKLALRARRRLDFESGFVSNGFLLSLYYLGLFGFGLYTLFWCWAIHVARRFPAHSQAPMCSLVAMAVFIVAADNYGFMYEPAASLLFLVVGLIAAERHYQHIQHQLQTEPSPDSTPTTTQGDACAA